jgi:hypothetical protein
MKPAPATTAVLFLFLMAVAGIPQAIAVTPDLGVVVDFSAVISTTDITLPGSPPLLLDGVAFSYDPFDDDIESAAVDSLGVWGTTNGALLLDLSTPATELIVDFQLDGLSTPDANPIEDAVIGLFDLGIVSGDSVAATATYSPYDPGAPSPDGYATGRLSYSGAPFDKVTLYFSTDAESFSISYVSYQQVPEPAAWMLMLAGAWGLVGWRLAGRKRR